MIDATVHLFKFLMSHLTWITTFYHQLAEQRRGAVCCFKGHIANYLGVTLAA